MSSRVYRDGMDTNALRQLLERHAPANRDEREAEILLHMREHDGNSAEGCRECAVRILMPTVRAAWEGKYGDEGFYAAWDRSDGYGEPGYVPEQGYDWSGMRDSTPEAKLAMYEATVAHERIVA